MAIAPESFWSDDAYNNPEFSSELLERAERAFGFQFPEEFISLLRIQNGGYTRGFVFPTNQPTSWADDHVPVDELYGIGDPLWPPGSLNIYDTEYMTKEWGLPPKQILLQGGGSWWITLDYRSGMQPSVRWIDVDAKEDLILAHSFADFFAGLLPSDAVDAQSGRLKKK